MGEVEVMTSTRQYLIPCPFCGHTEMKIADFISYNLEENNKARKMK